MKEPSYVCVSGQTSCGWTPDQTFECPLCCRVVCYCNGCHDDMPALCDDCWYQLEHEPTGHDLFLVQLEAR